MHRITIEYSGPADTEAFDQHFVGVHMPLVSKLPGLRRITTSHPRGLGTECPYFVAELWFDDADALRTVLKSPEMAETAADAQTFDVASIVMFRGEVVEVSLD